MPLNLGQLHDEIYALGLKPEIDYLDDKPHIDNTITALRKMLQWTCRIGNPTNNKPQLQDGAGLTPYGNMIKLVMETKVSKNTRTRTADATFHRERLKNTHSKRDWYTFTRACSDAEITMLDSLKENIVRNPNYGSPVIITDGNERPVGIIKSVNNPTGLALETIPESGLFRGMFFVPTKVIAPKKVNLKTSSYADVSSIGKCLPIRFSTFVVSTEDKADFGLGDGQEAYWEELLTNDISTICKSSAVLLDTAVPANLEEMTTVHPH